MRRSPGRCEVRDRRDGGTIGRGLLVGAVAGALMAVAPVSVAPGGLLAQVEGQPPEREVEQRPRVPELERPAQQEGAHEVRRGDTLWDLARRYLSDPLRWPTIFDLNTDIVEDPHWIYPGEQLRIPGAAPRDATRVAERPAAEPPDPGRRMAGGRQGGVSGFGGASVFDESPSSGNVLGALDIEEAPPTPLVSASDFYGAAFVADRESVGPIGVTVRKIEENPLDLSLPATARRHHQVVLALNGLPVEEGQRLQAIRWTRSLGEHGDVATPMALLEVRAVEGDSARVVVVEVYGDYQVGDFVIAAEEFEFDPATGLEPVESGLVADLIGYEVEQVLLGRGDMVFLDIGSGAGVGMGDEFAVFASSESQPAVADWRDRVAVVRAIRVRPGTTTAMVVDMQDVGAQPGVPARLVFRASGG